MEEAPFTKPLVLPCLTPVVSVWRTSTGLPCRCMWNDLILNFLRAMHCPCVYLYLCFRGEINQVSCLQLHKPSGWNRYNTRKRIQLTRCKVLQHSSRVRSLMAEDAVTVGVVAAALFDLVNCCCSGPIRAQQKIPPRRCSR